MKRLLTISGVLSWINLIVWGLIFIFFMVPALFLMNGQMIVFFFILSAIPLHSYASLKLGKSLKTPTVPLGHQTPVGIRLMGALTLFIGLMMVSQGITIVQHFNEVVKFSQDLLVQSPFNTVKSLNLTHLMSGLAAALLILGLFCAVNAVVSFQMLRSYLLARERESQDSQK